MIRLSSLTNIGVDEKSMLLATADKLEEALNNTRSWLNDLSSLVDAKYYTIGNHAILGSKLKLLLGDNADDIIETFDALNVQTGVLDTINFNIVNEELSESMQSADLLITALRAGAENSLQNVSDYLQVFMTKANTAVGTLTSQSKVLVNNLVSYITACNGAISKGISQFISTIQPKLVDGVIAYQASDYLGINPFIFGFSFMDGVDILSNVISATISIAGTIFFGAVGMLLGSLWNTFYNFLKYAVTSMQNPVDVYCRNEYARPCFDYSGTDITVRISDLPVYHWALLMNSGDDYCFYFPGFELHVLRTSEPDDLLTIRVIPLMLTTPGGFAVSRDEVFGEIVDALNNSQGIEEAVQRAAAKGSTSVIKPNQDSDELNLWSWICGSKRDAYILDLIFRYTNNHEVIGSTITQIEDLVTSVSSDAGLSNKWFYDNTGGNILFAGRSVLPVDPNYNYTNADWFDTLYKRHQKNTPTYLQTGATTLSMSEMIACVSCYKGTTLPSSLSDVNDRTTHTNELRATLLLCSLAGFCIANLTPMKQFTGNTYIMTYRADAKLWDWYSDDWLYRKFLSEERGAYAVYTDVQNAQRVGKIYTGLIVAAAGLTVAITAGVIKGQLKKKAFSEQRRLDNMCFDTTKTDKQCRAQSMKTKFWSALSGASVSTDDIQLSGQYLNNIIADAEGTRFTNSHNDDNARVLSTEIGEAGQGTTSDVVRTLSSSISDSEDIILQKVQAIKDLIKQ